MRSLQGAQGHVVRCAVAVLALAAVLGFAAEPSTSTQFDVVEGRGVAVVQAAHQLVSGQVLDQQPDPEPIVPVVLDLVVLGLVVLALGRRIHDAGGRLPSSSAGATRSRRGPPALV